MPGPERVLQADLNRLASLPGVAGAAEGREEGKPCVRVFLETDDQELAGRIPAELGGYPVVVERSGRLRALRKSQ